MRRWSDYAVNILDRIPLAVYKKNVFQYALGIIVSTAVILCSISYNYNKSFLIILYMLVCCVWYMKY